VTVGGAPRPGLYGFGLLLDVAENGLGEWLARAPAGWPALRLRCTVEEEPGGVPGRGGALADAADTGRMEQGGASVRASASPGDLRMDERCARVELDGGAAIMRRETQEAWFRTQAPLSADELVHPLLGHAALAFSHWMGREAFHAGVFRSGAGAWGLLGARGSGKSSTLAWLARRGQAIVADDLLVLDGRTAFVGPRAIDLAAASAAHLGWGEDLEHVRGGMRRRLRLGELAPEHPFAGWVSLAWGEELSMTSVPAAARIPLLVEHGHQPLGQAEWPSVLALASLPTFELRRPRGLESLDRAGELLLATTAAPGG
jgi:hypothetical protein